MKRRKFLCTAYILCALITLIFCYGFISSYEVSYFLGIQIQPAQRIASDCETLNIAMVIAGYETTNRAVILLKSILFYYQQRIHFHFITDHRSMDVLPKLFNTWQLADVEYSFYNSTNYINRVNWIPNNHYSKHFGLIKLLLADILPEDVKKVLLLDTDLLIVGEIQELIDSFSKLTNGKLYGLVENMSRWYTTQDPIHHVWPALGSGFNTGVALINLDAMRKIRWNHIWRTVAEENLKYYGRTMLADQDIINAIFVQNPHFIHRLPCHFNVQMGLNSQPALCKQDSNAFKIVHWNSPYKTRTKNRYAQFFRKRYEIFATMDGEMLRYRRSRECLDKDLTPSISTYEYEEDDDCGEFRRTRATIYRTQMFLRPVDVQNSSDITLVTQLNIERFPIFEKLISNWEGPISASIYASDAESFQLTEYWKQSRILSTRRNIAIHSIYKRGNFYPVNYLRNVAINGSKTEYLLLLDVDFLPSQGSHSILQRHLNDFKKQNALILPAFETVNGNSFESMNKNDFLELWAQKRVRPFRQEIWPQGHFATDFEKWKTSEGVYEISYQHDFEPYFLIRKSECPPFDERFVGFGWNKVAHSMVLNKMGYTFRVLPDVFLLHFDHPPSMEMLKFRTSPIYRKCMKMLKGEFVRDLIETGNF